VSLWLAQLRLNPRSTDVRRDLRDAVSLHQRVMSLVPDGLGADARQTAGVLYRVDETRTGSVVLIQARIEPDGGRLPLGYGDLDMRDLTPLVQALRPGTQVHYRLAANASKRVAKAEGRLKAGQVVALSGVEAGQWWQRQATARGLALVTCFARPLPQARGERRDGRRVNHSVTCFVGIATVVDADLVRTALAVGIGRGKSYGCGLLSLAPVRQPR